MKKEKECNEYCTLFRWNHCFTDRKDGLCDDEEMYDSNDIDYIRIIHKNKELSPEEEFEQFIKGYKEFKPIK